jgi:hypothetical protein
MNEDNEGQLFGGIEAMRLPGMGCARNPQQTFAGSWRVHVGFNTPLVAVPISFVGNEQDAIL